MSDSFMRKVGQFFFFRCSTAGVANLAGTKSHDFSCAAAKSPHETRGHTCTKIICIFLMIVASFLIT